MSNQYIRYPATGGSGGVTTINGLSGNITLAPGAGISITPSGNTLTIAATGTTTTPTGFKNFYVDKNRTDTYTPDGTIEKPFLAIQDAVNQVIINGDNSPTVLYQVNVVGAGTYNENVDLSNNKIVNIYFDGTSGVNVEPTTGYAFSSTSNNNLQGAVFFTNFQIIQGINFVGDTDAGSFGGTDGIQIIDCGITGDLVFNNVAVVGFFHCEIEPSGNVDVKNCYVVEVVNGFISMGGTLGIVTVLSDPKPPGLTTTVFTITEGDLYAEITIDAASQLDATNSTVGVPDHSQTLTVNGLYTVHNGLTNSNIVVNSGGTYTPIAGAGYTGILTINAGGTHTTAVGILETADPVDPQDVATKNYVDTSAANRALSNLTGTAINSDLLPGIANTFNIGNASLYWENLTLRRINDATGNVTINVFNHELYDAVGTLLLSFGTPNTLNFNAFRLQNVADPTNPQDAATKNYVDTATAAGANTFLSNLTSPTAINQDLLFAQNETVKTQDAVGNTFDLDIRSGNSSTAQTGHLFISTGDSATGSGNSLLQTGSASVSGDSGFSSLITGNSTAGNSGGISIGSGVAGVNSGTIVISSGSATGISGDISLQIGGGPSLGQIQFLDSSQGTIGDVWTSTDTSGRGHWATPTVGANQSLSNLTSPTAINQNLTFNTALTNSKILTPTSTTANISSNSLSLLTGNNTSNGNAVTQVTGALILGTGDVTGNGGSGSGQSGPVSITSGAVPGTNGGTTTGSITIASGLSGGINSTGTGTASFGSGNSNGAGASGAVTIGSGNATAAAQNSGDVTIQSGTATGTRGKISLNGRSIDANSTKINNVTDPTAAQDAATKNYVDTSFSGNTTFVKRDGTTTLTGNWDVGAKSITNLTQLTIPASSTTALTINTTSFIFDSTNNALGINVTPATNTLIDAVNSSGATKPIQLTGYGTGSTVGYRGRFARGTSGSPTAAQTGDNLSFYSARGYGTSQFATASTGAINFVAGENFTNTSNLTYITFLTTPTGSVTSAESMRISSTGITLGPQSASTAILQINGGVQVTTRTITANFTIDTTTTDDTILCNQSGAINVTLPTPTNGRKLTIKDISGTASTNNITVVRHAAEKIEGLAASKVLQTDWQSITFLSDGTDWFMM